jgi:SseB protein N-terminal domain
MTGPGAPPGASGQAGWRPATAAEEALRAAVERDDVAGYLAVVAETTLVLPVSEAAALGTEPAGWPVVALPGGATAVLAYTSPEALAGSLAASASRHYRAAAFVDLVENWPDPAWRLAIDPGLPIAVHLPGAELSGVVETVFAPDNEAEAAMVRARRTRDPEELLRALLGAELHLPCRPGSRSRDLGDPEFPWWLEPGGGAVVPAFTSERRLRGCLGVAHGEVDFVIVHLLLLVESWPDRAWSMAVNPGTPMAATLTGEVIAELAGWAHEAH